MKQILVCITISALLVSAGCSTGPRRGSPAPVVRSPSEPVIATEAAAESNAGPEIISYPMREGAAQVHSNSSAVVALLTSADKQSRQGDSAAAAATVERALRIEPRNARLWHQLASLRLDQKRYRMAADLAAKSNSLAPDDGELRRNNWRLIAQAKTELGDSEGARQARQMAR